MIFNASHLIAQPQSADQEWHKRTHDIPEISVYGARPMKEIGTQQTKIDTTALKENISLSMADVLTFNSSIFVKQIRCVCCGISYPRKKSEVLTRMNFLRDFALSFFVAAPC